MHGPGAAAVLSEYSATRRTSCEKQTNKIIFPPQISESLGKSREPFLLGTNAGSGCDLRAPGSQAVWTALLAMYPNFGDIDFATFKSDSLSLAALM